MKKKILSLILALVMSLSLMATAFAAYGDDYGPDSDTSPDDIADIIWNFTGADEDLNQLDEELPLTTSFKDVKSSAWYYSDVMECAKLGIVQGFEDGTFKPEDKVTGIQFIVMMTRTFYNDKVEAAKKTQTSSWYAPNVKVATDVGMLKYGTDTLTVNDSNMNRYDMAFVLSTTLFANNKLATLAQRNAARDSIKDAKSIPNNRTIVVYNAYHFGIITGMTDGTFSGSQSMTRAQACTVIMRMMKLINNYNPGDKDNDQYDDGKSQNQNQGGNGKLTNGKDATVANVTAMLKEIERKYPAGTIWGDRNTAGTNYYVAPATSKTRDVVVATNKVGNVSLIYACGGWACMVSETIFGQSDAPAREVYSFKDARPGDIVYKINAKTKAIEHVSIVTTVNLVNGTWLAATCDGNSAGKVAWNWDEETGLGNWGMQSSNGTYTYRIFTRYPQ